MSSNITHRTFYKKNTKVLAPSQQQLRAIAKRERRKPETMEIGTRLLLCQRQLEKTLTEKSPMETSPVQSLDQTLEPALLARLRIKETSSSRR
ncbi:hypothetical protein L914_18903 [Phytophthora nicotianae]|uniref:Uncharacterized protein n=1 Tax=Phytophthora nicotianae TaxID=4792 RepID=W2MC43_PHYNI|nr:hypothetical protein L914_18903 [Phytophthora nicotianae]